MPNPPLHKTPKRLSADEQRNTDIIADRILDMIEDNEIYLSDGFVYYSEWQDTRKRLKDEIVSILSSNKRQQLHRLPESYQ
jgi:hypothetical protein